MSDRRGCVVYFIGTVVGAGPIKIGCAVDPDIRRQQFATWSPVPLRVLATTPGYEPLERRFQWHFRHLWSHGEWFRESTELLHTIAEVAAGTFDFSKLPARGKRVTRLTLAAHG